MMKAAAYGLSGQRGELQAAFGIKTIGDLAWNTYFLAAQAIVALAAFEE